MIWYRQHIGKQLLSWLMISIISMLIINKALYVHAHVQASGEVIYHAHPFSKSNSNDSGANHTHTAGQCQMFENAELLFLTALIAVSLIFTFSANGYFSLPIVFIEKFSRTAIKGRAPPVLLFKS